MELTTTQFQEVLEAVKAHTDANACATFISLSTDTDYAVVVYESIVNQFPEFDQDNDGYIDNQEAFTAGVITHLQTLVNYQP